MGHLDFYSLKAHTVLDDPHLYICSIQGLGLTSFYTSFQDIKNPNDDCLYTKHFIM